MDIETIKELEACLERVKMGYAMIEKAQKDAEKILLKQYAKDCEEAPKTMKQMMKEIDAALAEKYKDMPF